MKQGILPNSIYRINACKIFVSLQICLWWVCCLLSSNIVVAQNNSPATPKNWIQLKEEGANFYDIRAAFMRDNKHKLREFRREMRREARRIAQGLRPGDEGEQANEGILLYMRWADFVEPRVAESNGDLSIITEGMARAVAQRQTETENRNANWRLVGPRNTPSGGGNGRVNAIRIHPTNHNTIFACVPAGGLWRSNNGGTSWTPIADNLAVLGATDLAFDPTNPNIMYLATGDGNAGDSRSIGVFKSTDGGNTWNVTGLSFTASQSRILSRIIISPTNSNLILACSNVGIWRSTNAGTSWTQVSTENTKDLEFHPTNPNIVYAAGKSFLRSTDGGATWATITNGMPATSMVQRMAIAVSPAAPDRVYVVTVGNDYGLLGFYASTNAGASFTLRISSPNLLGWEISGTDMGGQGWYDLAIAASPTDANTVYVGGINIWRTTDGGSTWALNAHWYGGGGRPMVHADIHDLVFAGNTIYTSTDGGIYKTNNSGSTWEDISSDLAIAQIYGIGVSASNPNLIISGHQDNGTNLTSDATNWRQVYGGDGMLCFVDHSNNAIMYASLYYGDFYRSSNGGGSFSSIGSGFPSAAWVTPWMQDPVTPSVLYAGAAQVYKSTNSGSTFTAISSFNNTTDLRSLDVAGSNNQVIVAATRTKIWRTTNGGGTWTEITTGLTGSILSVEIDNDNANIIYVGTSSYSSNNVFRSTDGGATWAVFSTGLPAVPVKSFVSQKNTNGTIFAGTDIGVYYRNSSHTQWQPFTNGMPAVPVTDLEIFYPTRMLRAATYGRGIYESSLPANGGTSNLPPSVAISSPSNNVRFTTPINITITANASDTDGTITRVEFYQGATLIGTAMSAPFSIAWTSVPAGNYTLTARAFDNAGASTISAGVNIVVENPVVTNQTPIVSFLSPNNNAIFTNSPATILVTVDARDNDGTITRVELYSGATLLTTLTTAPYTYSWNNVAAGTYTLTARAFDNGNASSTANVSFTVNAPPSVTLTSPTNNASFGAPANISMGATATDTDGTISRVEFYNGSTLLGIDNAAPFSFSFNNVPLGTYILSARAVDNNGAIGVSNNVTINVVNNGTLDAAVTAITRPNGIVSSNTIYPTVTLKNNGTLTLSSVQFIYKLDNQSERVFNWTGSLAAGASVNITFTDSITYRLGSHVFTVRTNAPNGAADANPANDAQTVNFQYAILTVDASLEAIRSPQGIVSLNTLRPVVVVKNVGTAPLTQVEILYRIDNGMNKSFMWYGSLASGKTTAVTLPNISYERGSHTFWARTMRPNATNDFYTTNDSRVSVFAFAPLNATDCRDDFEPNDLTTQAISIDTNLALTATIGRTNDIDIFSITTSDAKPKLGITLSNLPADYDLELYERNASGGMGRRLYVSNNGNIASDFIRLNRVTKGGSYYVVVYGYNNAFSANNCYTLTVVMSDTNLGSANGEDIYGSSGKLVPNERTKTDMTVSLFPNPALEGFTTAKITTQLAGEYQIDVFDMLGRHLSEETVNFEKGENLIKVATNEWASGTYLIRIQSGDQKVLAKLIVN